MSRAGLWLALLAAPSPFVFVDTIASDLTNYNLRTRAIAAGWNQTRPLDARVKINPGVVVSANSTGVYAFDTGATAYPAGSTLRVDTTSAFVIGMGGAGSTGGGGTGGPAVRVNLPTIWNNTSGTIGGGGGGGGGGQTISITYGDAKNPQALTGTGGSGGGGRTGRTNSSPNGSFASAGGGFAGSTQTASSLFATGGTGGSGGNWGSGGGTGGGGSTNGQNPSTSGPFGGGGGGTAIVGNGNINWVATGTRLGAIT